MTTSASRALVSILLVGLALAGCSSPTGPSLESGCLPAVRIGEVVYQLAPDERLSADGSPDGVVAVVQRLHPACPDTPGSPGSALTADGDSNFFPVGTTLLGIPGIPATERVAVEWLGEWLVLKAEGVS